MRKLFTTLAVFGLAAMFAAPASAAVVDFSGSIGIVIAGLPPLPLPGNGQATINSSGSAGKPITHLSMPGGAFAITLLVPLPNAFPIVGLNVTASNNALVSFGSGADPCGTAHSQVTCSGGGILHGRSGIAGIVLVGLFGTAVAPVANLSVPLAVLGGGSTAFTSNYLGITLQLQGAGWTTGLVSILNKTSGGQASTVTAMGGQADFGTTGNTITLVTPLAVFTNATGGYLPSFAVWTINLLGTKNGGGVPEPGMLLLLGSGVMGLALYGRRKLRK